ncbi:MAG TPA: apolipoprotein N-acyltransferase, partial [Pseudomonadales bacterium]|nr:apolipoprotein N-acyltransferase [Pseudomonadales bacterium]
VVVALHASLAVWLIDRPGPRRALACIVAVAGLWAGGWALSRAAFVEPVGESFSVSLVQGNIDQDAKWRLDMVRPIVDKYLRLTRKEWGRDLIVWPEAAVTLFRAEAGGLLGAMDALGKRTGSTLVLGIPDESESGRFLNTAMAIGDGHGTYIKRRLVPFGEYVPFDHELRGLIDLFDLPMANNQPGPWLQAPLHAGPLKLSVSICYEVVYPELVRATVPGADVFITISNDSWFGHSIGPWQHFQMARMRALENGRYMLRATNNGVTGIIDPHGNVVSMLPQFKSGVLRGSIQVMKGTTPFAKYGLGPLLILMMLTLTAMVLSNLRHVSGQPIR